MIPYIALGKDVREERQRQQPSSPDCRICVETGNKIFGRQEGQELKL